MTQEEKENLAAYFAFVLKLINVRGHAITATYCGSKGGWS